jgi:hypothetical protein
MWGARLNYDLLLGCKARAGGAHTRADASVMNCSAHSSVMKQCCLPPAGHRLPLFFMRVVSNETKLHVTCLHHSSASTLVTAQRCSRTSTNTRAHFPKLQFEPRAKCSQQRRAQFSPSICVRGGRRGCACRAELCCSRACGPRTLGMCRNCR